MKKSSTSSERVVTHFGAIKGIKGTYKKATTTINKMIQNLLLSGSIPPSSYVTDVISNPRLRWIVPKRYLIITLNPGLLNEHHSLPNNRRGRRASTGINGGRDGSIEQEGVIGNCESL